MSTIKAINIQHPSSANTNIVMDANGNMTVAGTVSGGTPMSGMRNRIINGDMRIDQRFAGSSTTPTASTYIADRWRYATNVASKFTLQQQPIVSPQSCDGHRYTLAALTASAYTPAVGEYFGINQFIEGFNVADLAWGTSIAKPVTLHFWVYCGLTGTFGGAIRTGDGSNYSYPFSYTISSANTWEKKTITIPGPTAGTWLTTTGQGLDVWFDLGTGSTFQGTAFTWAAANYVTVPGAVKVVSTASGSGGNWYVTGVQLEQGTVATSFERRPYGMELALCQRYYETGGVSVRSGNRASGTQQTSPAYFKSKKRANPTITITGGYTADGWGSYGTSGHDNPAGAYDETNAVFINVTASTGIGAFGVIACLWTANAEL